MNGLERAAVQRIVDLAGDAGVPVPEEIREMLDRHDPSYPARWWADHHPEDPIRGCCYAETVYGAARCLCWEPVYAVEQSPPVQPLPRQISEFRRRHNVCGDCAFRADSPERSCDLVGPELLALPEQGRPFFCHDGMRRPQFWRHPDGRTVLGSTADWQPPFVDGIPLRANGKAALLCAGWARRYDRARRKVDR